MEEKKANCIIRIKRRVSGPPGPPMDLSHGELAFNEIDGTLFIGVSSTETQNPEV
jgi:hypothetical protein